MNNRRRGHNFERRIVNLLKDKGLEGVVSCRYESKKRDDEKVDICGCDLVNIQCKTTSSKSFDFYTVLEEMPKEDRPNIIFLQKTQKANKNFIVQGEYAILNLKDMLDIIEILNNKKSESKNYNTKK